MLPKWSLSANLTATECDNDSIGGQVIISWHVRTLENGGGRDTFLFCIAHNLINSDAGVVRILLVYSVSRMSARNGGLSGRWWWLFDSFVASRHYFLKA